MSALKNFVALCFFMFNFSVFAQLNNHWCGSSDLLLHLKDQNEGLQDRIDEIDDAVKNLATSSPSGSRSNVASGLGVDEFVIPIVVHILHDGDPVGVNNNLSYNQILSQIEALNRDFNFNGTNTGHQTRIRFCLAENPLPDTLNWTNPTEPGVMRYSVSTASLTVNMYSPGGLLAITHPSSEHFPIQKYLNVWVVDQITPSEVGGFAGLPQSIFFNDIDGIVLRNDLFGNNDPSSIYCQCFSLSSNYDKGKVLTHEVGHYLGLYHTFEQQLGHFGKDEIGGVDDCSLWGDKVCDTPPAKRSFHINPNHCISGDTNTIVENIDYSAFDPVPYMQFADNPINHDAYDLIEDYMNYAYENCLHTFSPMQTTRMEGFLKGIRSNLSTIENLSEVGVAKPSGCVTPDLSAKFDFTSPACIGDTTFFSTYSGLGITNTSWSWDFGDGNTSNLANPFHIYGSEGVFEVTLTVGDGSNTLISTAFVYISDCNLDEPTKANWLFNRYAAIDFSSGIPIPDSIMWDSTRMNTQLWPSNVSISDSNGNLLFYTDREKVWNGSHQTISSPNNFGNLSRPVGSRSYGGISVPVPGNSNLHYFFTFYQDFPGEKQLQANIIDLSLDSVISQSFLPLPSGENWTSGDLGIIPHCNGSDYWLIIGGTQGDFFEYRISDQGITNAYMTSNIPNTYPSYFVVDTNASGHDPGVIKSSPDGTMIAISKQPNAPYATLNTNLQVFNVDPATGVISRIYSNFDFRVHAYSFSPNSKYLYFYKRHLGVFSRLNLDNFIIEDFYGHSLGGGLSATLGPDNNIYFTTALDKQKLTMIASPDSPIPSIVEGVVDIGFNKSQIETYYLPNFVDAKKPPAVGLPDFTVSYSDTNCNSVVLMVDKCWASYKLNWQLGNGDSLVGFGGDTIPGTQMTYLNPVYTYPNPGNYTITLSISVGTQTFPLLTDSVRIIDTSVNIGINGETNPCPEIPYPYTVNGSYPDLKYYWSVIGGVFDNGTNIDSGQTVNVTWGITNGSLQVEEKYPNDLCGKSAEGILNITSKIQIYVTHSSDPSLGSINIITTGTTPITYLWSHDAAETASSLTGLAPGFSTTVTVTDSDGCSVTRAITIYDIDAGGISGGNRTTCPGPIGPSNVVAGFTYVWTLANGSAFNHNTELSNPSIANPYANPFGPATYKLQVYDGSSNLVGEDLVYVNLDYDVDDLVFGGMNSINIQAPDSGFLYIRKIRGVLKVNSSADASRIKNVTLQFGPYTEEGSIDVRNGIWIPEGKKLTIENSIIKTLDGCEQEYLWRGIQVDGDVDMPYTDCSDAITGKIQKPGGVLEPNPKLKGKHENNDVAIGFKQDINGNFNEVDRKDLLIERPTYPLLIIDVPNANGFCIKHGQLYTTNNTVIQDAKWGVRAKNVSYPFPVIGTLNAGGGIVNTLNTTFKNNETGIYFGPTTHYSSSIVRQTSFIYNKPVNNVLSPNPSGDAGTGIELDNISGVQIADNLFKVDVSMHNFPMDHRGTGILSHDASFKVIQVRSDVIQPFPGDPLPITGYGNRFENFYKGMDMFSIGTVNSVQVKSNTFDNCVTGITSNGTNFDEISRNVFNVPQGTIVEPTYGVEMFGARDYIVKENKLNSAGNSGATFGVVAYNAQNGASELWKNEFFNVFQAGTQTEGIFSNLNLNCNEFNNSNISDITIWDEIGGKIGNCLITTEVSSNIFHPNSTATNVHINNQSGLSLLYESYPDRRPLSAINFNVISDWIPCGLGNTPANTCPVTTTANTTGLQSPKINKDIHEINGVQDLVIRRRLRNEFVGKLIRDGKLNQAIDILYYRDDNISKQIIANTYAQNGFYTEARAKASEITVTSTSDQYTVDFVNLLINSMELGQYSEDQISPSTMSQLSGFSWNEGTEVYAQSGLEYLNQSKYRRIPRMDVVGSAMVAQPTQTKSDQPEMGMNSNVPTLVFVPNPFSEVTSIISKLPGTLIILDNLGRKVAEKEITNGAVEILASELNETGLYFVILQTNDGQVITEKLIFER